MLKYGLKITKFNEKCEKLAEDNKIPIAPIQGAGMQNPRENYHALIFIPLRYTKIMYVEIISVKNVL